jgi:hypothetical protein
MGLELEEEDGPPARISIHLTEEQLDDIADRAVKKAFDKIYAEVGKSVVRKIIWLAGLAVVGFALWLAGKDALPK